MIKVHRHFLTAEAYVIEVWEELTTELYYAFDNMCVCVFMCVCGGGGSTNFTPLPPMPPHVFCGLPGPPTWAWQECNRLLRLGRP